MDNSTGKALSFVGMSLGLVAVVVGLALPPSAETWPMRIIGAAILLVSTWLFWRFWRRKDAAPDYLRQVSKSFFECNGLTFAITTMAIEGIAYLVVYFQNQRDQSCVGRVALRLARAFMLQQEKAGLPPFEFHCEPGAFGVVTIPLSVVKEAQGTRQAFEVGASAEYPQGKGARLRFRKGIPVQFDADFSASLATNVGVALTFVGGGLQTPAKVTIALPRNVAEVLPSHLAIETKTLWRLGDAPADFRGDAIGDAIRS